MTRLKTCLYKTYSYKLIAIVVHDFKEFGWKIQKDLIIGWFNLLQISISL